MSLEIFNDSTTSNRQLYLSTFCPSKDIPSEQKRLATVIQLVGIKKHKKLHYKETSFFTYCLVNICSLPLWD